MTAMYAVMLENTRGDMLVTVLDLPVAYHLLKTGAIECVDQRIQLCRETQSHRMTRLRREG